MSKLSIAITALFVTAATLLVVYFRKPIWANCKKFYGKLETGYQPKD